MKLRLFIDKSIIEISNVKLREGYIPSLSQFTYAGKLKVVDERPTEFLEPAIWFKVFLMDVLTIDCNFRSTYWTLGTEAEDISDITDKTVEEINVDGVDELKNDLVEYQDLYDESYKLGDDCVDYFNDLDEVYDVLPSMLSMYKNDKITKDEFYKSLIKLIHVNVLPNVKLLPEHLDLLKKCFHAYKRYMKCMNDIIAGKTSQLSDLKATKLRERQKFLRTINTSREPKIFDELVSILEGEYRKDLERIAYDYRKMQMDYVRLVCDNSPLEVTMKLLEKVESMKTEIVGLNDVLENIKKLKNRSGLSKVFFCLNTPHKDEAIMQNMYLKMKETEDILQKKVFRVMDKKLMLLTVYENMRNVIQELMEGYESYGVDFDTKSRMKSNILAETCVSTQWKSLPEHVNIILSNLDHDITKDHYLMVGKVKEILMQTLKKYKAQCLYNYMVPQLVKQYLPGLLKSNILESTCDSYNHEHTNTSKSNVKYSKDINRGKTNSLHIKSTDDVVNRSHSRTLLSDRLTRSHSTSDLNLFPLRRTLARCLSLTSTTSFSNIDEGAKRYHKKHLMTQPSFQSYIERDDFIKNNDFGYLLETIQQLRPIISDHFKSICMKLNIEIDNCYYRQNFRKIWVIYENYFYEHILSMILELYRAQFASKTEVVTEWIFKLTLDDLDMTDTKTTRLLLTSQSADDSCTDSFEDVDGKASSGAASAKAGSDIENSGSSGSLINAIIEGLTTQEEVFYELHSDDVDNLRNGTAKKLGNVASAVDRVLKSKMRSKLTEINVRGSNSTQKLLDSGLESSVQSTNDHHDGENDGDSNVTPHSLKPKSEKKYFSTSLKPLTLDLDKYITESSSKPIRMKPLAMNRFLRAFSHMKIALKASTPLVKTHHMCRCLKEVSNQLIQLHKEVYNSTLVVCNDTLMDGLIILVCNLDNKEIISELYVQLQLMTDTLADLFEAGEYRFALVMFQGVCQYLQDKTMMKKNRLNSSLK